MSIECQYYNSEEEINTEEVTTLIGITEKQQDAWSDKYSKATTLARYYDKIDPSKASRIRDCGSLVVLTNTETQSVNHYRTSCNVRLCPLCAWRKGIAIAERTKKTVGNINNTYKWVTLTLTIRNCTGEQLPTEIGEMNKSLSKMMKYAKVTKVVKGHFASLEVTYNKQSNTYHPHFHILLAVLPSYFKKADYRIKNNEWIDLWQRAMGIDYKPQVKVKAVKDNDSAVDEVSSYIYYSIKGIYELLKIDSDEVYTSYIEVIDTIDSAMSYKRAVKYGGCLKPTI